MAGLDDRNRGVSRVTPPDDGQAVSLADSVKNEKKNKSGKNSRKKYGNRPNTDNMASINRVDGNQNLDAAEPDRISSGTVPPPGNSNLFSRGIHALISGIMDLGGNMIQGVSHMGTVAAGSVHTVFTKIGSKVGLSPNAAGMVTGCIVLATVGVGGYGLYSHYQWEELVRKSDVIKKDCAEEVEELQSSYAPTGDVDAMTMENAQKIWAVGKAIGLTDEQCAGMLGNFMIECGLDPSCIEGIYDEPFQPDGPRHVAARDDLCAYMRSTFGSLYISSAYTDENGHTFPGGSGGKVSLDIAFYVARKADGGNGCFSPGIGLAQFTGFESSRLLAYAKGANKDWWDLDLQLAFIIAPVANGGYERGEWLLSDWKAQAGNPSDAAIAFNLKFEGNSSNTMGAERAASAVDWYTKLKGYSDNAYAQSILEMANTILANGSGNAAADAEDECADAKRQYDNSDLARAAVAYAYETIDGGRGNDGTELYRLVHDAVFPGDTYYQSCDRGVTTAVRWSGTDDEIEAGYTDTLDVYFRSSPKWEDIGEFDGDITKLEPGDILNTTSARMGRANGHIVLYVSNEIVREKFPNSDASFVSASLNDRSPGCEIYHGQFVGKGYHIYRNVQKEANPKYTNVAEGFTGQDR